MSIVVGGPGAAREIGGCRAIGSGTPVRVMPGWIFVSFLLAAATLLAAVAGRPLELVATLAVITLISAVAGALRRPDRQAIKTIDEPQH